MKPLERIFFCACIMKNEEMSVRDVIQTLCTLGFSEKQLLYYVFKWDGYGFYDYGVALDLGWFEPDKLIADYKVMYEDIMRKKEGGKE